MPRISYDYETARTTRTSIWLGRRQFRATYSSPCAEGITLSRARDLRDLMVPPSNQLESLRGDRQGQYSIRINKQWRVCFKWKEGDAFDVEIVDYH